ncbi:PAS domain S-box protein [Idiomarina sp. A28L]|uniref:ATP-binding protein n=1 Tax=Idiomarina sp. A28L TaxID=1036674 RepID=UPI00021388E5|nr:ATP-binding protein [Idiomarina sp. A28L]EGN76184.1 PAS domain S-box protein [Idiomarina sp. A28L]
MDRSEYYSASGQHLKWIAALVFVFFVAVAEYLIWDYQRYEKYQAEQTVTEYVTRTKSQLESELNGLIFLTHGIEAYVLARNGEVVPSEIKSILNQVYTFSAYFRNIGIAPGNELRWVFPLEGNELAIGIRYEELPGQWADIKTVIDSRAAKLIGPVELVQGNMGLIYRSPLYIDDLYWGMVSAVIDAESLFSSIEQEANLAGQRLSVGLRKIEENSEYGEAFFGAPSAFAPGSTLALVNIPGGQWELAVAAEFEVANVWPARIVAWVLILLGVSGLSYVTRYLYQNKLVAVLASEVEEKTNESLKAFRKLDNVLQAASETAIIATDNQGIINVFNKGAERMLGYSAADLIGNESPGLFHEASEIDERAEELSRALSRNVSGFSVFTVIPDLKGSEKRVWTYITKSGARIPVELTVTKEFDSNGNASGYLALAADVSERLHNQNITRELKERLEAATAVAQVGVWELDLSSKKMLWNEQMFELTGVSSSDFTGSYENIERLLTSDYLEPFNLYLYKLIEKTNQHLPIENPPVPLKTTFQIIKENSGELRWMKGHAIIKCDEIGVPVSMLGTMIDISGLVFAREAAEKAEKLKSEFLSTVSHELRTPLSVISGALSLISLDQTDFSDDTKSVLNLATRNSQRLTLLINDLLDMEKTTSGSLSLNMKNFVVSELIEKAIADNSNYAKKYNVGITLKCSIDERTLISVDELRFMQIMSNLLSNAAKYAPHGTSIQVAVEVRDSIVVIKVIDQGAGIPETFKNRIFQPFAQADSSDSKQKGGTGLGLSITRAIVQQMNGEIGFDSESDEGTIFWFSFPIVVAPKQVAEPEELLAGDKNEDKKLERKPKILHVEDNADFATIVSTSLKNKYRIDCASTVHEARAKLEKTQYELMVLDIALPDGSGLEVLNEVKLLNSNIKIIVVSDYDFSNVDFPRVDAVLGKAQFTQKKLIDLIQSLMC